MAYQTTQLCLDVDHDQQLLKIIMDAWKSTIKEQDEGERHHKRMNEISKNKINVLNMRLAEAKNKLLENNQELKRYALKNADMEARLKEAEAKLKLKGIDDEIEHTLQDTNIPCGLPATLHDEILTFKTGEEAKLKQEEIDELVHHTFRYAILPLGLSNNEYDIVKKTCNSIEGLRAHFPPYPVPKASETTVGSRDGDGEGSGEGDVKNHASTPTAPGSSLTAQ
ncbi:hypothetical protein N0V83_003080 [Neocucurbitaria cava]|uniref:Uncharacterized protein n=1 Tax=Neocucurbitaria cava TaxID=798079 RepID=A0A9W8YDF5_9PLEO|nr:hypothetical protein N0V83_003080 [Neocucurbitaria cava]